MEQNVYCAIDVGGTKILLLLIDGERETLYREKFSTPIEETPDAVVGAINRSIERSLAETGRTPRQLAGIGVCSAGLIDYYKGQIYQAANLSWYKPVPLRSLLEQGRACPVCLENDANAAVLGEVVFGAARGHRNAVYITISTGIGAGLYLDGKIYRGSTGFAGEFGHIKPFGKGRKCGCGGLDCLETWASGEAVTRSARLLWDQAEAAGGCITTAWVFDRAQEGNTLAQSIIDHAVSDIGTGLANLVTLLNPTCLVVGGGVTGSRADFLQQIREKVTQTAIAPAVEETRVEIVPAQLEPEAGVWGMYALMTGKNNMDGNA